MSTLRLGAYKLPAAEVVLVQTLFRLYAHGDAFRWTFVTAPPYDALLADGTTDEGMSPAVDAMAKAVLRLTRMNSGQAPTRWSARSAPTGCRTGSSPPSTTCCRRARPR